MNALFQKVVRTRHNGLAPGPVVHHRPAAGAPGWPRYSV